MSHNFSYSDTQSRIPVFSGDHYDQWVQKMGEILYYCGLLNYVENGCGSANGLMKERDGVVLNYIRRGLSPQIRPLIKHTTKAKQAWDILYDMFERNSKVHRGKKVPPQNSQGQGSFSIFTLSNAAAAFVVMKEVADAVEVKNTISSEVENLSKKYGRYFKGSKSSKNKSKDMGSTAVKLDNPYVDAENSKGKRSTIGNYDNPNVDAAGNSKGMRPTIGNYDNASMDAWLGMGSISCNYDNPYVNAVGNSKGMRSTIGNYDNASMDAWLSKEHKFNDFNEEGKPKYESTEPSNNFQTWGASSSSVSDRRLSRSSNKKQFTNYGNENHLMGRVLKFFLICFVTILVISIIYLGLYCVT